MAAHSSFLAQRIPGTGEPGGLPSMGSHRVGHDLSDLAQHSIAYTYEHYRRNGQDSRRELGTDDLSWSRAGPCFGKNRYKTDQRNLTTEVRLSRSEGCSIAEGIPSRLLGRQSPQVPHADSAQAESSFSRPSQLRSSRTFVPSRRRLQIKRAQNTAMRLFLPVTRPVGSARKASTLLARPNYSRRRRQWQPTPVFLPGKSHGRRSLVGCRLWSRTEWDTTEATQQEQQLFSQSPAQASSIEKTGKNAQGDLKIPRDFTGLPWPQRAGSGSQGAVGFWPKWLCYLGELKECTQRYCASALDWRQVSVRIRSPERDRHSPGWRSAFGPQGGGSRAGRPN